MNRYKYKDDILFLVEPFFHGIQYIEVANKIECEFVIIRRENGPIVQNCSAETIVIDIFDTDAVVNAIKERLKKREYKNVGIISGNDFCVSVVSELNQKLGFRTNSKEASLGARNKILMRTLLEVGNVKCPRSRYYKNIDEIIRAKSEFVFPVVVKPPDMTSSMFVKLVHNFEEFLEVAKDIFEIKDNVLNYPIYKAVMVEEYAAGPEFSIELFLEEGKALFSSVTEKHKGELPHFVEIAHVVPPTVINDEQYQQLVESAMNAVNAIGLRFGPAHVEMVFTEDGPSIIELAARIGGDNIMHVVRLATDVYMPELTIDQVLGYDISNITKKQGGSSIRFLTANPGKVIDIKGLEEAKSNKNLIDISINVGIGDEVHPLISSEERVGYIITVGNDGNEAYKIANEIADNIKIITE